MRYIMLDTSDQARTARCLKLFRSKTWILHLAIAIGLFYHHFVSSTSVGATSTYNFIANQRPRFQIPHGNLSYYRSPQWEVLYYLKFGTFPFYSSSSPYLNRTQYLNKIRMIKNLMDRTGVDGVHDFGDNETDTLMAKLPHDLNLSERPLLPSGALPTGKKSSRTSYYPLTQLRKNVQARKAKRDSRSSNVKEIRIQHKHMESKYDRFDYDYIVVDGDPGWFRNRVVKQISIGAGGGFYTGGEGIFDGFGVGGMSAELAMERKMGRKFQTQGWRR